MLFLSPAVRKIYPTRISDDTTMKSASTNKSWPSCFRDFKTKVNVQQTPSDGNSSHKRMVYCIFWIRFLIASITVQILTVRCLRCIYFIAVAGLRTLQPMKPKDFQTYTDYKHANIENFDSLA